MFIMLDFLIGTHFFKKNIKFFFAFHAGEGSKNYFFTLDESEPLIFFMFLPHLITRFVLKETEKKAWGGKLFSFFKGPKSLCPKFGIWNRGEQVFYPTSNKSQFMRFDGYWPIGPYYSSGQNYVVGG